MAERRGMTGIGVLILFIALVLVAAIASGVILDTAGFLQNRAQDTGEDSTKQVSSRVSVLSTTGIVGEQETYNLTVNVENSTGDSLNTNATVVVKAGTVSDGTITPGQPHVLTEGTYNVTADADNYTQESQYVTVSGSDKTITIALTYDGGNNDSLEDKNYDDAGSFLTAGITAVNMTVYRSPGADDVDLEHATIEYLTPYGNVFLTYDASVAKGEANFTVRPLKDTDRSVPVLNQQDDRVSINLNLATPSVATNESLAYTDPAMQYLWAGDKATVRISTQHGAVTTYVINVPESLASDGGSAVLL